MGSERQKYLDELTAIAGRFEKRLHQVQVFSCVFMIALAWILLRSMNWGSIESILHMTIFGLPLAIFWQYFYREVLSGYAAPRNPSLLIDKLEESLRALQKIEKADIAKLRNLTRLLHQQRKNIDLVLMRNILKETRIALDFSIKNEKGSEEVVK